MELLEQLKSGLTELTNGNMNGGSQNVPSVINAAIGILLSPNVGTSTVGASKNGYSGGVAGSAVGSLINDFRSHNVMQVDSWVKPGKCDPITPQEVERAIGTDTLAAIAAKAGLSHPATASALAQVLPKIIDKLTPGGQIPDDQTLYRAMGQAPSAK